MKKLLIASILLLMILLIYQQVFLKRPLSQLPGTGVRIVSLSPTLTETLFELGEGEQIVGVTNYCTYPDAAGSKTKVGDLVNPDLEKILQLRPSVVFAEHWSSTKIVNRLKSLNLNVIEVHSPGSIDEIYQSIETVGKDVGKTSQAQQIVANMRKRVEAVTRRAENFRRRPGIYIEIDLPTWTVGRASYTHEAVTLCGVRNIFGDVDKPALLVSQEAVIQRNPDVILSFEATADQIRARPGWGTIDAVRKGKIIDHFNRDLFSRGNSRLVQGMEEFQARLEALMRQ
jgi:iron complex transport system substrate-binding protein